VGNCSHEYLDWPGFKQVCKLERQVLRKGEVSTEARYFITSLALKPKALLEIAQRTLGNREPATLGARRYYGRGCLSGADRIGSSSDGGPAQRGVGPVEAEGSQ